MSGACGSAEGPFRDYGQGNTPTAGGSAQAGAPSQPQAGGPSAGGAAPATGEGGGGQGELGGDGGAAPAEPSCDDRNPCTEDRVVDSECTHSPSPDGTACDDADFCTLGDACKRGACISGDESRGPVEALGRVDGFGSQGVVGTGTGRYLFYEVVDNGVRFSLVELEGDQAKVLHHRVVPGFSFIDSDYASVPATSLGEGRVAFATIYGGKVLLLDVSGDEIVVLSVLALPFAGEIPHPASFAAQGNRLWVCANTFFFGGSLYEADLTDPSAPKVVGQFSAPACGALAASQDGERLYLNTSGGVYAVDVSHVDVDGAIEVGDIIAPNSGIAAIGPYLVFREAAQVRVVYEADLQEAFSIPVAARGARLVGNRLFLQGTRTVESGLEFFLSVYDISSGSPELLDDVVTMTAPALPSFASQPGTSLAADPEHAIQTWTKRVYRLQAEELTEMTIPGLGSLAFVAGRGDQALALERGRTQAFDVSEPALPTPTKTANYLFDRAYEATPVLYESFEPQQIHFGFSDNASGDKVNIEGPERSTGIGPMVTMRLRALDAEVGKTDTFFQLSRETSVLSFEGGNLYRLITPQRGSARVLLQRWGVSDLPRDGSVVGAATDELELVSTIPWINPQSYARAVFDVDALGQRAALIVSAKDDVAGALSVVHWLDLSVSPPVVLGVAELQSVVTDVRIAQQRLALAVGPDYCCDDHLVLWERGGEPRSLEGRPDLPDSMRMLAFDGRAVYASGIWFDAEDRVRSRLYVVPWQVATPAQSVEMQSPPTSLAAITHGLVIGSRNELVTIRPYCSE